MTEQLKIIGIEEHMWSPGIRDALAILPREIQGVTYSKGVPERLSDTGDGRIQDLEGLGIDQQILSITTPATQVLEPAHAVKLARKANDLMAEVVARNPDRFPAALATLPMTEPSAAAEELERCVTELGLKGSMIHGRTGDRYLDHPDYAPVLQKSAELKAPIFIHPQRPVNHIADELYSGQFSDNAAWMLSTGAWGWHVETGLNAIRLVVSGAFDRAPSLQIILGHWGEMVPFWLPRLDEMLNYLGESTTTSFAATFREHFWVGPSGIWNYPMMHHVIAEMGVDHILFGTDYPFVLSTDGAPRRFLEEAPLSTADKHKIGHRNLETLLRLGRRMIGQIDVPVHQEERNK